MNARTTANLVFGCALSAMAAGCTVHAYSGRPEYPSTAFTSREHVRHEVSFHTAGRDRDQDRDDERGAYRPDHYRPAHADVRTREEQEHAAHVRDTRDRATTGRTSSKHETSKPAREDTREPVREETREPVREETTAQKPPSGKTHEQHVELMPAKPDKAKPARKHILSFQERLELLGKKTREEVAQKERERRERMNRVLEASRAD